jgi:hypothetical protein
MRNEKNRFEVSNFQSFQRDQRKPPLGESLPSDSIYESVKDGVQNNRNVLVGIGMAGVAAAAAATLYLLRTERGRDLTSQISTTVSDGMCKIQETVGEAMSKVKDSIVQLTNRLNQDEIETSNSSTMRNQLRRVV